MEVRVRNVFEISTHVFNNGILRVLVVGSRVIAVHLMEATEGQREKESNRY